MNQCIVIYMVVNQLGLSRTNALTQALICSGGQTHGEVANT